MHPKKGFKIEKYLVELMFVLALISMVLFVDLSSPAFAEVEYWEIESDGEVLAVVSSKEAAESACDMVEQNYTRDDAENVRVSVTPGLEIVQKQYSKFDAPKTLSAKKASSEVIKLAESGAADIEIRTVQQVSESKPIESNDVVKKTDKLIEDAKSYYDKGEDGIKVVTQEITTVNGEVTEEETVSTEVLKEATHNTLLVGTRKDDKEDKPKDYGSAGRAFNVEKDGKAFTADLSGEEMGDKVAEYALNWVGNPYVWAGTSLTKGADCSGFTLSVYRHYGISLPHNANTQRNYGVGVKLKDARPGDLICFPGHVGIYIGDNKIVHAMNTANGITTSKIGYNGKPIVAVRRLFPD